LGQDLFQKPPSNLEPIELTGVLHRGSSRRPRPHRHAVALLKSAVVTCTGVRILHLQPDQQDCSDPGYGGRQSQHHARDLGHPPDHLADTATERGQRPAAFVCFNHLRPKPLPRTDHSGLSLEFDAAHSCTLCRVPASMRRRADLQSDRHSRPSTVIPGCLTQNHNQAIDEFLSLYDQFCTGGTDQVVILEGSLIL